MTWARRRVLIVCVAIVVTGGVSACKVPHRLASQSADTSVAATSDQIEAVGGGDVSRCRFSAGDVSAALGGVWTVTSLPSGGCTYSKDGRTILVSEVPLPRDHAARTAALAQSRRPCDTGSAQQLARAAGAFVCRQGTLVEAATIAGDHLVVAYTAAGSDPAQLPGIRESLTRLLARLD